MAVVERMIELDQNPDTVWGLLRQFGGITVWMKGLTGMQMIGEEGVPGTKRVFPMPDGADPIIEELIVVDDADRVMKYSIVEFMYPLHEHRAALSVTDNHDGTTSVLWHTEYSSDPETEKLLEEFFGESFESGLANLEEYYASR